jgi:phage-related protein
MSDGRVIIDTSMDTSDIRRNVAQVNQELNRIGETIPQNSAAMTDAVGQQYDRLGRRIREVYRGTSPEAQRMSSEMRSAFAQQRVAMSGLRDDMIGVQYGYFQMARGARDYQGTNEEFMSGIEAMGKKHKKINDQMMANNEMAKMSFYQSVGAMLARSTQASKIGDNFERMGNPLYNVNQGLLRVADGMNRIAMQGQPAALALKMLGPTANMKQLQDMTMMITQGLMRFTMVAMIAAVGAGLFYKAMHDGAMETNAAYATAFKGMLSSVREAFQPMIDVFAAVMPPVYNFIAAIANLVIKFNEANPVLSKIIAGFLLLIPALTLILSPLAIGIGLFGGLQAAMGAIWMIIGPIVTGFAAMMGTVLVVAAAIAGLAAVFYLLWTRSETFRSGVISAWNQIKAAAMAVFAFLAPYVQQAMTAVKNFVQQALSQITAWWQQKGAMIIQAAQNLWNFIKIIFAGIGQAIIFIWPMVLSIIQSTWTAIKNVIQGAITIITGIISFFSALFTGNWSAMWAAVKQILMGALQLAWGLINLYFIGKFLGPLRGFGKAAGSVIKSAWNFIKGIFTATMATIRSLVTTAFNAYRNVINGAMRAVMNIIRSIWNTIRSVVTGAVNAIRSIITSVFNGIRSVVTAVMNAIRSIITSVWNAARSAVTSAVNSIRSIVTSVFNSLRSVVSSAMNNVKSAIVNGWNAAKSFLSSINLSSIGKNIIQGLVNGIKSMVGAIGDAVASVANKVKDGITGLLGIHSPSRWMRDNVGKMIPAGVGIGIEANTGAATKALSGMTKDMMVNAPRQMASNIMAKQPSAAPSMASGGPQVINLNIDGQQVGQVIVPTINRMQERQRSFKAFNKGVR